MKTRIATLIVTFALIFAIASAMSVLPPARAQSNQTEPTSIIMAQDGYRPGHIIISWTVMPDATHYRIGYINAQDFHALLLANPNADWRETVLYTELAARDLTRENGRTQFTVQHLEPGVQHFFTVLTSSDARWDSTAMSGTFAWPTKNTWLSHVAPESAPAAAPDAPPAPGTPTPEPTPTAFPNITPTPAPAVTPTPSP